MEKRTFIAVALSIAVLVGYQMFFAPKPQPPKEAAKAAETPSQPEKQAMPVERQAIPAPASVPAEEKTVRVETDFYIAELTTRGGTIKSFALKKFHEKDGLSIGLLKPGGQLPALSVGSAGDYSISDRNFALAGGDLNLKGQETGVVIFEYVSPEGYAVKRAYKFFGDSYKFELNDETTLPNYELTLGTDFGISSRLDTSAHAGPVVLADTKREELTAKKLKETKTYAGNLKWVAQEDKYFFAAVVPLEGQMEAKAWAKDGTEAIALRGASGGKYLVYAGPKEHDTLKTIGLGLEHIVDFGFFSVIARPLFWFMKLLHKGMGNWGWAIIVLTIVVRIPFVPIINKGQMAMKRMQDIQPKMQALKEKHKKDPQQLQKEMMELYKKHKVNPMSGCLPMLIQIPVFFALYKVLNIAIELRGAPFALWVTDLSLKDPYYVLPIVMGLTMVLQQKMTPSVGDPTQRKLMMLMPVIFTFLFVNFASGLVLYWLVNNILSIAQQLYINKKVAKTAQA